MQGIIEQKQMKDFMRLYTGLVERCFDSCVNDFTSKTLSSKEVSINAFGEPLRVSLTPVLSCDCRRNA
jgi:hypothetical protein